MVTVNWMFDEIVDIETDLALGILDHILIGTPASPLHKALIDSGLGEALAGSGLAGSLRQTAFSIGLKGVEAADADKVEPLILAIAARRLPRDGIDRLTVEASRQYGRVPPAREQYRFLPARHRLDAALAEDLAVRSRSVGAAGLRGAARRDKGAARRRRTLFRGPDRPAFPREPAPHDGASCRPDPEQAAREAAEERGRLDAPAPP